MRWKECASSGFQSAAHVKLFLHVESPEKAGMCLSRHFLLSFPTRALGIFALSNILARHMHSKGWFDVLEVQEAFSVNPYFSERCLSNGNTQWLQEEGVMKGKLSFTLFMTTVRGRENWDLKRDWAWRESLVLKAFYFGKGSLLVSLSIFLRSKSGLPKTVNLSFV